mgnify:FL=1
MKNVIKKVPIPLSGVMLGLASLGNLLQSYPNEIRYCCGILACFLLILLILKLILFPGMFKEDLKNPIIASVAATFPMALMILSTYVKPFIGNTAFVIWIFSILLHMVLIVYFTATYMLKLQMPKVFASYYIVYVGIAVAAITAPAYGKLSIGAATFWFGLISLIVLLILVTYRYLTVRKVPEPAKPLFCIYAAPASLCIAGYTQSVETKSYGLLIGLMIVAAILYVFAIIKAVTYLSLPFYPSYASFTFPFVISAIAMKQASACLMNMGKPLSFLSYVVMIETVIAVIFVAYTFSRFMGFLFADKN